MSTWSNCSLACRSITSYSKFTIELVFQTLLHILLNVLPSFWAYPGSYSPSAHVITFSTSAVNVVNESVWRNLVDQCFESSEECLQSWIECLKVIWCFRPFPRFNVLPSGMAGLLYLWSPVLRNTILFKSLLYNHNSMRVVEANAQRRSEESFSEDFQIFKSVLYKFCIFYKVG